MQLGGLMNDVFIKVAGETLRRMPALKPRVERALDWWAGVAGRTAGEAHRALKEIQWGVPPQPEWFDHSINLHWQWHETRTPWLAERGSFGGLALKGKHVLELCCGDGFNARNFYSIRSESVMACDFDPSAIRTARRKNSAPNVRFIEADIRTSMPLGHFDNVVWDAAIEHFTPDEMRQIFQAIRERLNPGGILSGYTIVEGPGGKALSHHEYEFRSKEDLLDKISAHFQNVTVFETVYTDRHNLYFWASDGPIPFSADWEHAASVSKPRGIGSVSLARSNG